MANLPFTQSKTSSWAIALGAQGIAAAQFARCGFDVLSQSGGDKPWYDLAVTKTGNLIKVSVKASDDGRWNLTHDFGRRPAEWGSGRFDSRGSIDLWLNRHGSRAVCCLVQFEGVAINQLPRIYLASPAEIAEKMSETVDRLGHCMLYEQYTWTARDSGLDSMEMLPSKWRFSPERIEELMSRNSGNAAPAAPMAPAVIPAPAQGHLDEVALSA